MLEAADVQLRPSADSGDVFGMLNDDAMCVAHALAGLLFNSGLDTPHVWLYFNTYITYVVKAI